MTTQDHPHGLIRIQVPIWTPSQNVRDRTHWRILQQNKKSFSVLVRNQITLKGVRLAGVGECFTVFFMSSRPRRILDHGNLVGGSKDLLDALTLEKFIFDDSYKFCMDYYGQQNSGSRHDGWTDIWRMDALHTEEFMMKTIEKFQMEEKRTTK